MNLIQFNFNNFNPILILQTNFISYSSFFPDSSCFLSFKILTSSLLLALSINSLPFYPSLLFLILNLSLVFFPLLRLYLFWDFIRITCTIIILKLIIKMAGEDNKQKADYTDIANGPINEAQRQCRDIICCILFLANVIAMIYCAIQGYSNGNTSKIWRATDTLGNVCGQPGGLAEFYPYAYFTNPLLSINNRACVQSCPSSDSVPIPDPVCYSGSTCALTGGWTSLNADGTVGLSLSGVTFIKYGTYGLMNRICLPNANVFTNAFATVLQNFSNAVNTGAFGNFISDLTNNWPYLLAAFGFCVVVSFIWMYALKCLAGCIVWVSIFGLIFGIAGLGVVFIYNSGKLAGFTAMSYVGYLGLPTASQNENYDIYAYICFGITGLLLIILLCCCSRIRLAVAVCKAAGQFVANVCMIVLVPIWQTILVIVLWVAAIIAIIWLASSAQFTWVTGDVFTSIKSWGDQKLVYLYYFVFGTLWTNALFQAMGTFVIASACAMWYYSHGPGQELDSPILRSYKMVFRYHLGSLAFGSLILAIVQFMQLIVQAFKKQAQSTGADKNPCFQYVINCLRCCLACVQRIVQFINKTAYIQIAIRGKNFCSAAFDGFELVWSNAMRYAVVGGIGQIIMFLGKIMIAGVTCLAFYILITYPQSIAQTVFEPILLVIIVFIMAYAVGTLFMAVYSVAMDTLLACFIIDETNQKAKGGKAPLYAPQQLAQLIDRD